MKDRAPALSKIVATIEVKHSQLSFQKTADEAAPHAREILERVLVEALLGRAMLREILELLPHRIRKTLTLAEKQRLLELIEGTLHNHPDATAADLLCYLAIESIRPRTNGRRPKWTGTQGVILAGEVEATMALHGLKRTVRKGLPRAIAILKNSSSQRYNRYSEERLRKAYYTALPRYKARTRNQSGKASDLKDRIEFVLK